MTRWSVVIAVPGRTWAVELSSGRSAVVGEASSNAVCIADAGLAERHVSLLPRDEGVVVEPLRGGGEVLINDVPAGGQSTLQSGDELRLGDARLLFTRVPAVAAARARLTSAEELLARLDEESRRAGAHRSLGLALVSSPGLNVAARQALVRRVVDEVQRTGVTACFGELTSEVLAVVLPELSPSALVTLFARLPQVAGPRAVVASARAPEEGLDAESLLGACWDQLLGAATDEPVFVDATMVRLASLTESLADDEGAVCVVGGAGSGRRTLLAQLARAAGRRVTSVSALDFAGLTKALGRSGDWLLVRDVDRLEPAALREVQDKARSRLLGMATRAVSGFAHVLEVPPLAARREDVLPLAEAFVTRARVAVGRPRLTLSAEARSMLQSWAWPGNVRELVNVMARAARAAVRDEIGRDALPTRMALEAPADDFRGAMASAEREVLLEVLARTRWNVTAAATRLGMPRRTLVHRMGKLGLKRPAR